MDTIDRLAQTGEKGIYLKWQLKDTHGQNMPEIRNWKWSDPK